MAGHRHDHGAGAGDRRVLWAVVVNVLLTFAQIVGGVVSGSLSLIADAIHNFSDAASLIIAFGARRIARRPADETMTFGYVRAEIVAALINYTTLIVIGLYLVYEAVMRFFEPQEIAGWTVVVVAGIALVVDVVTAILTYALSKESMNIRAAFLHNVADALGSVGVIVAGSLILLFGWQWIDPVVTLMIAGYILWQAFSEIGGSIRMLMLGTPHGVDVTRLAERMRTIEGVESIHHVHVFAIDEETTAVEAHVVSSATTGPAAAAVRSGIRALAREEFGIAHATLELEEPDDACSGPAAGILAHGAHDPSDTSPERFVTRTPSSHA
ncbi:cation diffusion facilitator family transporter [Antarcticirhabdus aurantiaca]|uniref:Cation diffusion facilitator family transporter n=1 Tax=Antarcticirhabdus aurantiaca TaxID=2606717 RepID=A0ACD4NXT7_9HYPH|nr:cation diffusion facilitator family transporter [Antarcticirhabdus aurantiaca]WAJ31264.1 cation diffusion facilitator family transporter [Jeongeuplla avenae]